MNLQDAYYHGIIFQLRRVLSQMSEAEIDAGLSAFEDGAKNWSDCFFARTVEQRTGRAISDFIRTGPDHHPEALLQRLYGIETAVPFRMLYHLFDEVGGAMVSRPQLVALISNIRDERRPEEVIALLRSMNFDSSKASTSQVMCGTDLP